MSRSSQSRPRRGRRVVLALGAVGVSAALAACGSTSSSSSSSSVASAVPAAATSAPSTAGLTTVTVGVGPFLDNQTLALAEQLGYARQQGIHFAFKTLPSNDAIFQAIASGQIDMGAGTLRGLVPLAKTAPTLRNFIVRDQFLGFFLVGRRSAHPAVYSDLVAQGVPPAQARLQVLRSWLGKTMDLIKIQNFPPIAAALQGAGLDPSKVNVNDFSDDAKAALAFENGTGDYYTGALPQQAKLLLDHPQDFVNVGGYQVLGPAGLAYDTWTTSQGWLDKNPALALKVLAVTLKTSRYINERLDQAAPALTTLVNTASSGSLPVAEVKLLATQFSDFLTPAQLTARVFNTTSPYYWGKEAALEAQQNASALPSGYQASTYDNAQAEFAQYQATPSLVSWVNGPLG